MASPNAPLGGPQPMPVALPFLSGLPSANGKVIFVDAVNGSDGNDGASLAGALKTLSAAHAAATDGDGDVAYLAPGDYTAIAITKNYFTMLGQFEGGYARPDITGGMVITAQGFVAKHCRFVSSSGGVDTVIQRGNGFLYEDCVFDGDSNTGAGIRLQGLAANTHLTASEGRVLDSLIRGNVNGIIFDTAAAPNGVGSTDNLIRANVFRENSDVDILTADSGVGLYSLQFTVIDANILEDKNKATYVDLTTANGGAASDQSGTFSRNVIASDTITTTKIKAVGTAFTFPGNMDTVGVFDGSGLD
jgi:hypothetical protein